MWHAGDFAEAGPPPGLVQGAVSRVMKVPRDEQPRTRVKCEIRQDVLHVHGVRMRHDVTLGRSLKAAA